MKLAIVTPEEQALSVDADEVVAPGENGELGILPGHIPLISALRPGVLTVVRGGKRTYYAVSSGFVEIEAEQVSVLTDSCEEASTIDRERAKRAFADAEEKLKTLGPDDPGYLEQRRRAERAQARLDAVARRA